VDRILLTGGLGFIGGHTVEHILKTTESHVVVLDGLNHAGDVGRVEHLLDSKEHRDRVTVLYHDLRAPVYDRLLSKINGEHGVDTIINMAAMSHVDTSIANPRSFIRNNVDVAINALEAARELQPRVFIQVSTDEVYGAAAPGYSHHEWDVILPSNPYAGSKASQEAIAISYWRTYGVPLIITNTMNNFGERQHPEKFLPKVVRGITQGKTIPLHGDDSGAYSSRKWLHARNHADALLWLAQYGPVKYDGGDHERPVRFNVVGDMDLTVHDIAVLAGKVLDMPVSTELVEYHSSRPGHDMRYSLDGTALAMAGWDPPMDFYDSFAKTVRWMVAHHGWL